VKLTILSFDSWGPIRSRKHHLATELAKSNYFSEVIYVAPPSMEKVNVSNAVRNLQVYTPFIETMRSNSPLEIYPLSEVNKILIISEISDLVQDEPTVLWMQSPGYAKIGEALQDCLEVSLTLGDFTDDYAKLIPELREHFSEGQELIGLLSDIIYAVSETYCNNLKRKFPDKKVVYLPNAVDEEFLYKESNIPEELKDLDGPIVGYVGRIVKRLDVQLVEDLLRNFPDVNFVFVGTAHEDISWSKKYDNFFMLGPKDHSTLPDYIDNFDICILPHRVNEVTALNDPVKLYDYLSRGKKVISTNVEGVRRFSDVVNIASTREEFIEYVSKALKRPVTNPQEIVASVYDHTWKRRAERIIEDIRGFQNA